MIEKHNDAIFGAIPENSFNAFFGTNPETFSETIRDGTDDYQWGYVDGIENESEVDRENWSGRVDLNHRLHGPEPCALPS